MFKEDIKGGIRTAAVWAVTSSLAQAVSRQLNKTKTVFVVYHGISRDTEQMKAWTLVHETVFYHQMAFLKNNFECLSIEEALTQNRKNRKRPGVVVTFDN